MVAVSRTSWEVRAQGILPGLVDGEPSLLCPPQSTVWRTRASEGPIDLTASLVKAVCDLREELLNPPQLTVGEFFQNPPPAIVSLAKAVGWCAIATPEEMRAARLQLAQKEAGWNSRCGPRPPLEQLLSSVQMLPLVTYLRQQGATASSKLRHTETVLIAPQPGQTEALFHQQLLDEALANAALVRAEIEWAQAARAGQAAPAHPTIVSAPTPPLRPTGRGLSSGLEPDGLGVPA